MCARSKPIPQKSPRSISVGTRSRGGTKPNFKIMTTNAHNFLQHILEFYCVRKKKSSPQWGSTKLPELLSALHSIAESTKNVNRRRCRKKMHRTITIQSERSRWMKTPHLVLVCRTFRTIPRLRRIKMLTLRSIIDGCRRFSENVRPADPTAVGINWRFDGFIRRRFRNHCRIG